MDANSPGSPATEREISFEQTIFWSAIVFDRFSYHSSDAGDALHDGSSQCGNYQNPNFCDGDFNGTFEYDDGTSNPFC